MNEFRDLLEEQKQETDYYKILKIAVLIIIGIVGLVALMDRIQLEIAARNLQKQIEKENKIIEKYLEKEAEASKKLLEATTKQVEIMNKTMEKELKKAQDNFKYKNLKPNNINNNKNTYKDIIVDWELNDSTPKQNTKKESTKQTNKEKIQIEIN